MDLSISPDWDARLCYAVVFACGIISAQFQLYKRFQDLKITGFWLVPNTWLVFAIYLAIPLGLFWLMDRMSALNDTSLFAALLVGLAYPAILAGGFGGIKAPSGLDGMLKPLEAFTDTVIKSVIKTVARYEKRFEDFIVGRMRFDKAIFDEVLGLAKSGGSDSAALDDQLKDLDGAGISDSSLLLEKRARLIYLYLSAMPDFLATLTGNRKVMGKRIWNSPIIRTRVVVCVMIVLFCSLISTGIYVFTRPTVAIAYHTWRIGKPNNSERDRFRARENLLPYLHDAQLGPDAYQSLARAIRSPGLPIERVDLVLQLLLQARDQQFHQDMLCNHLVNNLRVESVDARSRIQQTLVFLAEKRDPQFKQNQKALAGWNPTNGDSVTSLEDWIGQWKAFFTKEPTTAK
ncbi:MAG: hypothetical protein KIS67_20410 [Verrucomicrobiae bacterium]|nr:hypothetical protein [Verrucomicrobiae bacterium]